jgi:hypothetical protein
MALIYTSGFLASGSNSMTCTIAGGAATVTAASYIAGNLSASAYMPTAGYTAFTTALAAAFDAAGGGPWTVTFSYTTGKYTVSRGSNFTLSFSGASDLRLRSALGFTGNKTGASTYTSDETPKYVTIPAIAARSSVSNVYEAAGIVEEAVSDGGDAYGTALRTGELLADWTQAMESKAATFSRTVTSPSHGWCWEAFFIHHRSTHPFSIYSDNEDESTSPLFRLRADGASFVPQRVASDDDTYWNIRFLTRDLGEMNA